MQTQWTTKTEGHLDSSQRHTAECSQVEPATVGNTEPSPAQLSRNGIEKHFETEEAETCALHSQPNQLQAGDRHYCERPLDTIL